MPELPVKEGRLPELHLPEISRDEIMRTFAEIKRPDLDLSGVEWPKVDLSRIEFTREDLDKAILGVATAARLVRPVARSRRMPLALGVLAVAGLATFAVLSRPAVRDRLARTAREARRRAQEARSGPEMLDVEADVPVRAASTEAVAIPIEPDAYKGAAEGVAKDKAETVVTEPTDRS